MKRLKPLTKESLPDQIFGILKSMITNGQYKPGDKMPSENELAQKFNVNRLTVRMAIQKLNAFGLVETRAGEGTFVKKFSFKWYIQEISDFYITPEMLNHVCEFRKHIELECARLAIELGDEKDIADLEYLFEIYAKIPTEIGLNTEEGIAKFVEADIDFHYHIVKMSKNSLYILAYNAAREAIRQYMFNIITQRMERFLELGKVNDSGVYIQENGGRDLHKLLLDSIKERNFDLCKQVYSSMIDYKVEDPLCTNHDN